MKVFGAIKLPAVSCRRHLTCCPLFLRRKPHRSEGSAAQYARSRRQRILPVMRSAAEEEGGDTDLDSEEELGEEEDEEEDDKGYELEEVEEDGIVGRWLPETPKMPILEQRYLHNIAGNIDNEAAAAAAADAEQRRRREGASRREAAAALLKGLPGIKPLQGSGDEPRDIYAEWMEETRSLVVDSPPLHSGQIPLDEWELRAIMEKRRAREEQRRDWERRRSEMCMYPTLAADWRSDARILGTGDPTGPTYREWTHEEIWDLITLGGKAVDPRRVKLTVLDPQAPADPIGEGAKYVPETEEWLAEIGKLIDPQDEQVISDRQGEEAMLASEFTDFDEEYLTPGYTDAASSYDEYSPPDEF